MATQFELEKAIKQHVASISTHGSLTGSDVKELTAHLLDTTEGLIQQGLSEEEAFIIAIKRLGPERQLAAEYEKLNPSVKANRVWAYLLFGFIGLTGLYYLGRSVLFLLYDSALKGENVTLVNALLVSAVHLSFSGLIVLAVFHKRAIAAYLQRKLRKRPLLMLANAAFVMMVATSLDRMVKTSTKFKNIPAIAVYEFKNPYIEFTFYLLLFFIFVGILSLFFTVRNPENSNWKSIFSRPSIVLLLVVGFATELLAATTRVIPPHEISLLSGLYFGLVYFFGALAVTSGAGSTEAVKYLCWFGILGLILEIVFGIQADISRMKVGGEIMTPIFVGGLLAGVTAAYFVNRFLQRKTGIQSEMTN